LSEWRQGWQTVFAAIVGTMTVNLYGGTLGVLMPFLGRNFGWTRAQLATSVLIVCSGLLTLGPAAAWLMNRYGPRRTALTGMTLYALALVGVGLSGPRIESWYLAWGCVAMVNPMANNLVWTAAINRLFRRSRGLALSVGLSGVGVAAFIAPLLAAACLSVFGWRACYFAIAVVAAAIALPVTWKWFLLPGESAPQDIQRPANPHEPPPAIADLLHNRQFWQLALSVTLVSAGIATLVIHLQPIMRDAGMSAAKAAAYASLIGPAAVAGRLFGGYLLDRIPARLVAGIAFALPAAPCMMLLHYDGAPTLSSLTALLTGVSLGVEGDIVAFITARYLGLRQYATTYSILFGCFAIGAGFAPVIAGAVFDAAGSYDLMLKLLAAAILLSGVLIGSLGRPSN
jgi:predicted MFS family arabinose efflux permease